MIEYVGCVMDFCLQTDRKNSLLYESRGQGKTLRRLKQNFSGKMAELYVNKHLKAGCEDHILKDYGMGVFHSDLSYQGRGFSIKSQDQESISQYGSGRFVFGINDPLRSDVYCGVIVDYQFKPVSDWYFEEEEEFKSWCQSIEQVKCKYDFVCKRAALDGDVWAEADGHLKGKKVLLSSKIALSDRLDLKNSFPKQ
jgi:hypothetical protein